MRVYRGEVQVFGHTFKEGSVFHPLYAPYTSLALSIWAPSFTPSRPISSDAIGTTIKEAEKVEDSTKYSIVVLKPLHSDVPLNWFRMPHSFGDHFRPHDPFLIPGFHPLLEVPSGLLLIYYLNI